MPAVIALCLQINLEEMTLATGKRKIAKAILPDRQYKQGTDLPVKPPAEAKSEFAEPVLPRRAGHPSPRVAGAGHLGPPLAFTDRGIQVALLPGDEYGGAPCSRKVKPAGAVLEPLLTPLHR